MRLNKIITAIIALCLSALLLAACDAPGVKYLEEMMPPLTEYGPEEASSPYLSARLTPNRPR